MRRVLRILERLKAAGTTVGIPYTPHIAALRGHHVCRLPLEQCDPYLNRSSSLTLNKTKNKFPICFEFLPPIERPEGLELIVAMSVTLDPITLLVGALGLYLLSYFLQLKGTDRRLPPGPKG